MTRNDIYMLSKAVGMAYHSGIRFRVGAYCPRTGGDWNTEVRHPRMVQLGYPEYCNRHAELALALRHGERLTGETVYVARILRDGSWALAKPCVFCMHVLSDLRVDRVVWTTGPQEGESITL